MDNIRIFCDQSGECVFRLNDSSIGDDMVTTLLPSEDKVTFVYQCTYEVREDTFAKFKTAF